MTIKMITADKDRVYGLNEKDEVMMWESYYGQWKLYAYYTWPNPAPTKMPSDGQKSFNI